jgi:tetratricopeptide (TPR) repeat protein
MKISKFFLLIICTWLSTAAFSQNIAQATKLFQQEKYDEAFAIFKTVKSGSPQYAESRYYMGQISFRKKEFDKAEDYTEQAIDGNKNVAKYHVAMSNVIMRLISNASMIKQASLASKLRNHLEEAVRINPNDMNSSIILVGFYKQAPGIMGGSDDKAKALADQISKLSKADGHLAFALIYHIDKDFDKAEKNYKSSITLAPDSVKYYYSLAQFYHGQKNPTKAVDVYEQALNKFPDNKNLLLQIGRVFATTENTDVGKGIEYLNTYIKSIDDRSDLTLGDAYYYLGLIEKNRDNKHLAITHFNQAIKINPNHRWAKEAIEEIE